MNTKKKPLVSVIIPCFNCEKFIGAAIESCLSQTYRNIEILVLEDRGTDRTLDVAKAYEGPLVRVLQNEQNLGQHENKNRGIALSQGELIKFCDGDDVLDPDCVERMVQTWNADACVGLVVCRSRKIDADGQFLRESREHGLTGAASGHMILEGYFLLERAGSPFGNPTAALFTRRALEKAGGFPRNHSWSGDLETFLKILCDYDVSFCPDILVGYRLHSGGVGNTRKITNAVSDNLELVNRMSGLLERKDIKLSPSASESLEEWPIWINRSFLLPNLVRRYLRRRNKFPDILEIYKSHGIERQAMVYCIRSLPAYIMESANFALRRMLKIADMPPLFSARFVKKIQRHSQASTRIR